MNENKNVILVCEDQLFYDKIKKDFNLNVMATVFYEKRRIVSVKFNSSIFFILFKTTFVVTEYANFIPRLITIITFSEIHSILYGFLNKKNFIKKLSRFRFLNLLFYGLYSDKFIVVNRIGTFKTLQAFFEPNQLEFLEFKRPQLTTKHINNKCIVWISQCWGEIGKHEIENKQQSILNYINNNTNLIVVAHPRDKINKYERYNYLNTLIDFKNHTIKNGMPTLVLGFSSSALLELKELNYNVKIFNEPSVEKVIENDLEFSSLDRVNFKNINNFF